MEQIIETCKRSPLAMARNIKRLRQNISQRNLMLADLEDENCTVAIEDTKEYQALDVANMEDNALLTILEEIK